MVVSRPDLFQGYLGFGAHNAYFELATEIGVLGGLAFFVVTAMYATRGVFIATRNGIDRQTKYLALGLSAGMIGFVANTFTSNTFQHPQSGLFFWILAGVVAALGAGVWQAEAREPKTAGLASDSGSGSLAVRWLLLARARLHSLWRESAFFAGTATPRRSGDDWFSSSVAMRALFGPGPDGSHKED